MSIQAPSAVQLRRMAAKFGLELTDAELAAFTTLTGGLTATYDRLDELPEPRLPVR